MGRQREAIQLKGIEITDAGAKGIGIGRTEEGRVLMVRGGVPGDLVDVQVLKTRRKYWEGQVTSVLRPSPDRIAPRCSHFGVCGGCKWQNMAYEAQLRFKQREVEENLRRIGELELPEVREILGAPEEFQYRNKMEFSFSSQRWLYPEELQSGEPIENRTALGFHMPGMWDKIIDLDACYLAEEPTDAIRRFVKSYAEARDIPFFTPRNPSGVLRSLMIRTSSEGEVMVLLQTYDPNPDFVRELARATVERFPRVHSFLHSLNRKANDSLYDLDIECVEGRDYILHRMEQLEFRLRAKSFYQTNTRQAYQLYSRVREMAALSGQECVYDLYTGTGTIALFLASQARKVVGIESVPDAIRDARDNAAVNGISNVAFEVGDMRDVFTDDFVERHGKPDLVITDPPRDGMHGQVVAQLLKLAPDRMIYVSCNSATQARDLGLIKHRYQPMVVQPVDMFPQTHHVENIVLLQRYA